MKRKKFFAIAAICGMIFSGCGDEKAVEEKPVIVKVRVAEIENSGMTENYPGKVKGRYETDMAFQVGGKIISRRVQPGSAVNAGDVLMTIDPKDFNEQLRGSDAAVSSAKAQLELAKNNFERYAKLFEENAISAATLDQYRTQYNAAQANYESAIADAQYKYNATEYTNLTANAAGIISNTNAEVGQVVAAGQKVLTLIQTNELEVAAEIPENKISEIREGMPAKINFWATDGNFDGTVREISPMADNNSRTFSVKITLTNPPADLKPGMTANAIFNFAGNAAEKSVVLPLAAIYQAGDKPGVWVVKDNRVNLKNVEVKNFKDNAVKVSGINPGEVVVVAGTGNLREGLEVRTIKERDKG